MSVLGMWAVRQRELCWSHIRNGAKTELFAKLKLWYILSRLPKSNSQNTIHGASFQIFDIWLCALHNIISSHSKHRLWRMAQAAFISGFFLSAHSFYVKTCGFHGALMVYSPNAKNFKDGKMKGEAAVWDGRRLHLQAGGGQGKFAWILNIPIDDFTGCIDFEWWLQEKAICYSCEVMKRLDMLNSTGDSRFNAKGSYRTSGVL